VIIFKNVKLH